MREKKQGKDQQQQQTQFFSPLFGGLGWDVCLKNQLAIASRTQPPVILRLKEPSAAESAGKQHWGQGLGAAWQCGSNLADNFLLCFSIIELASMETVSQTSANAILWSGHRNSSGIMRH